MQHFYFHLHRNDVKFHWENCNPFPDIQDLFETVWLPRLNETDYQDYAAFKCGGTYEDLYDFPHGQLTEKSVKSVYQLFKVAYREFREETGFKFSFTESDVHQFPLIKLEFRGCDDCVYTQYYFVVENVSGLRRFRYFDSFDISIKITTRAKKWTDDRFAYEGKLVPLHEAYLFFKKQQDMKNDKKYLLCEKCVPKEFIISYPIIKCDING